MKKRYLLSFTFFLLLPLIIFAAGKVEINTASLQELDELVGIGPALGQRIIDARPFSLIDDLLKVAGIGEKTLQKIKDQGLAYVEGQTQPIALKETEAPIVEQAKAPAITYPGGIVINEVLPAPTGIDEDNEWIEIYNKNDFAVDLFNWKIYDTEGKITQYIFPLNTKIEPGGYLVLRRPQTKIILNNSGDRLVIYNPSGIVVDEVTYKGTKIGQAYNRKANAWVWSDKPSPDAKNIISEPIKVENKALLASLGDIPETKDKTNTIILIGGAVATALSAASYIIRKKLINKKS